MKIVKFLALVLVAMCTLTSMSRAQAPFDIYRSTNAFFAALNNVVAVNSGNTFTTNFSSLTQGFATAPISVTNNPFGYQVTVPGSDFVSVETWGGLPALATIATDQALLFTNLSSNTRAFGAYFFPTDFAQSPSPITNATINITGVLDDLSSFTVTTNVGSLNFNDYYFGFISTNPARSIVSFSTTVNTNVGASFATGSEVTISTVPEPSTYALLGLAVAALAAHVVRRRA
jgi:hypothetical protein